MIRHYLTVALVKFSRSLFATFANVLTLALGLACFIAAYGIAAYWQSADRHHSEADRTFVVGETITFPDRDTETTTGMSSPTIARYLATDFPEIERVARAKTDRDVAVAAGESKTLLDMGVVDPGFLEMFDFTFVEGSREAALADPTGVVLTRDAAERLFGSALALGRSVMIDNGRQASVTGVIAPVRRPSIMGSGPNAILSFDMLAQWNATPSAIQLDTRDNWMMITGFTFISLSPGTSVDALNAQLPDFVEARVPPQLRQSGGDLRLEAFPVNELTTVRLNNIVFARSALGLSAIMVLMGLGTLTLVVAGVNYANLSTAQAISRAKEIGMRKVVGAGRLQVMMQSWIESLLLTVVATILAFGLLMFAAPAVKSSTGIDILYFLTTGAWPFTVVAGLVVLVALAAGAYPALVMSRVRPVEALQAGRSRPGSGFMQDVFIVIQFASASFLLILVTVMQLQRTHLEETALAPHEDPIIFLNDLSDIGVDYDTLEAQLARLPGVKAVSAAEWLPWTAGGMVRPLSLSAEPAAGRTTAYMQRVGYDYFSAVDIGLVAGRVFDRGRDLQPRQQAIGSAQPRSFVIDAALARNLGFGSPQEAAGKTVYFPSPPSAGMPAVPATIIGVTEAETARLEATDVSGKVYELLPTTPAGRLFPMVRIGRDGVAASLAAVTRNWDAISPRVPAQIRFFDELFEMSFRTHERMSRLFMLLAGAAFVIAAIGQLGIAAHVTARRRHEIGVRKVLGSTSLGIVRLLLFDLAKPVLIANLIAWPFAYLAAQAYLQAFALRIALTPIPFALGLIVTLAVAWAAVVGEVLKAAALRPAEVLRHA